jgi:cold shock CspA family protein
VFESLFLFFYCGDKILIEKGISTMSTFTPPLCYGIVKFYNDDKGWGVISLLPTALPGTLTEGEVFVHRNALRTITYFQQGGLKLVTGEYVQLNVEASVKGNCTWTATSVNGIGGGPLLCEHGDIEHKSYTRINWDSELTGWRRFGRELPPGPPGSSLPLGDVGVDEGDHMSA